MQYQKFLLIGKKSLGFKKELEKTKLIRVFIEGKFLEII